MFQIFNYFHFDNGALQLKKTVQYQRNGIRHNEKF